LDGIASASALDLESALLVASARARAVDAHAVIFVGHGADTFRGDGLAAPLREMQQAGQTLIVVGGNATPIADAAALTGGQSLPWDATTEAVPHILSLLQRTPANLEIANAERFFAVETATGETRWLARFVGSAPDGLARADARELEKLWTRAHVAATAGRDTEEGERHRVLTPLTSILVLESTADYARWGIPAPERAGDDQLARGEKRPAERAGAIGIRGVLKQAPEPRLGPIFGRDTAAGSDAVNVLGGLVGNQIGEAYGTGALGLVGTGSGGGGTGERTIGVGNFETLGKRHMGYGRGAGGLGVRSAQAAMVLPGQSIVRGSLDKEIIRRIIHRHINELKYCYDQELAKNSALSGRLSIQFVIAPTGQVWNSVSQSSTLNNVRVENCVVQALRRWEFPKPSGGGITIVSYPFNFIPGGWDGVAQVAPVPQAPLLPSPWDVGLTALRGKGDKGELKARIAKVAGILAAPATESPSVLAWWIVERYLRSGAPVLGACILAANLLREANQPHEAGRILSEAGGVDGVAVIAEFRRWSSGPDVARLTELAARQ
jgi:hypothetical protein